MSGTAATGELNNDSWLLLKNLQALPWLLVLARSDEGIVTRVEILVNRNEMFVYDQSATPG
jgi:hypothetical protein